MIELKVKIILNGSYLSTIAQLENQLFKFYDRILIQYFNLK